MSDVTVKKLEVMDTIKDGIGIGVKNIGSILVNLILYILTVWIPYLNVGTTIGLLVGVISKASKGEAIPFTEIFDAKYRRYMGEFFLTCGLMGIGIGVGIVFFIIPGIVIAIAWYLAPMLAIDKGKNPSEAITISNNITYGNKWRIFGIFFLVGLVYFVAVLILSGIGVATGSSGVIGFMGFISIILSFFYFFVVIGLQASLYKQLASGV